MVTKSKTGKPPGPKGKPLVGSALDFGRAPIKFVTDNFNEFGDIIYFKLGIRDHYQVNNPDYIKHILQDNNSNYAKAKDYDELKLLLGQGLLTSEGDYWLRHRRIAQPAFHHKQLASLANTMTDSANLMLNNWENLSKTGLRDTPGTRSAANIENNIELGYEMMRVTLEIVSKTLLSTDVTSDVPVVGKALTFALQYVNDRIVSPFTMPTWLPTPKNLRFARYVKMLNKVVLGIIAERRKNRDPSKKGEKYLENDLLTMLMETSDEETGHVMNDEQLRDEVMTIFLAGHETSANALTWIWYLLSQHPQIESKLHAELQQVLDGRTPSVEDIPKLKYTKQIIEEGMRLYPPVWIIGRKATADDEIGGYKIPKNSDILIIPYVNHHHPGFWEEPEVFNPERFTPENSKNRHRYHYFPFGGGQRFCIGSNFAMMEMQLLLATIAQRFRLRLAPGHKVEKNPLVTLRPKYGMMMFLEKR